MGAEGGLVTARIESPRRIRRNPVTRIEAVIDIILISRVQIDRWCKTIDGHLNICTPLCVSLSGALTPTREYAGWPHNADTSLLNASCSAIFVM
jgi:hypothetical protein